MEISPAGGYPINLNLSEGKWPSASLVPPERRVLEQRKRGYFTEKPKNPVKSCFERFLRSIICRILEWARSSGVERLLDTQEVSGSIPLVPTTFTRNGGELFSSLSLFR